MNLCWFVFKWGAILAIVAALATSPLWYRQVFFRMEEEIRQRVETTIAAKLPHLEVHVRGARLAADGIEIHGLSIAEPAAAGPRGELVYLETVFVTCNTSPQELFSGQPAITAVRVSRPAIRATRRADGSFSLSKLTPPESDCNLPPITIESGAIEVFDPLKTPASLFTFHDVNATLKCIADPAGGPPLVEVRGCLLADHLRRVELSGILEPKSGRCQLAGSVSGLEVSPELRASLPEPVASRLEPLSSLRVPADLTFNVWRASKTDTPRFEIEGSVTRGRLEHPRLPYPLTDVSGSFRADNSGFTISDVTARDGSAQWEVKHFQQHGYAPKSPFMLRVTGRQIHLDSKWADALAASTPEGPSVPASDWSRYWKNYDPTGHIHLDCTLLFDGQRYHPTLEATCLDDVTFSFSKFPYRLERARGKLTLRNNVLTIGVVAFAGPRPISLNGRFLNPGPQFTGGIEIRGDKISLDDKLFAAVLKPKSRETLIALNPRGLFNVYCKLWRSDPAIREMRQYGRVTLDRTGGASIRYDKFPYALVNLEGLLELHDGQWSFNNLVGSHGTGIVWLSGRASTLPNQAPLEVTINADNVPLDEELRAALPGGMRRLWDSMQPHGKVDVRNAVVRFDAATRQTNVRLRAIPRDDSSLGTSIEPVAFPYRMRLLGGWIDYADGHATLHQIRAAHGVTALQTRGSCDIWPDGSWQLRLSDLSVDRIRLHDGDHELASALPEGLRRAVAELKPEGQINLKGVVEFSRQNQQSPLHTGWDVHLIMHQGSLQVGPKLENIFGRVWLRGSSAGARYASQGELHVDSVTYKNFQFTDVQGPLWFDNANVYLGTWGPRPSPSSPAQPHVQAKWLGGTLAGDCHVSLGPVPRYHLAAGVANADLAQFARENVSGSQKLQGKIAGRVELFGTRGPRNMYGTGVLHLSDADVYELPLMSRLLKIARAKPPDATAFTQSDIVFDIQQGTHIILKQINLNGDAINLSGNGELTLDGQNNPVNMTLHMSGGRGGIPLVSGMLKEASQQILLIHVGGTLEQPTTRAEPLPAANQALQMLQPKPDEPTLLGQPGDFLRNWGLRR